MSKVIPPWLPDGWQEVIDLRAKLHTYSVGDLCALRQDALWEMLETQGSALREGTLWEMLEPQEQSEGQKHPAIIDDKLLGIEAELKRRLIPTVPKQHISYAFTDNVPDVGPIGGASEHTRRGKSDFVC